MTLLESSKRCVCGHGPWAHSILAFRAAEGQILRTTGICSDGSCLCHTYEERPQRAVPPRRPRRFAPIRRARTHEA